MDASPITRTRIILVLVAAAVFALGINWGLPSRDVDAWLCHSSDWQYSDSTKAGQRSGSGIQRLAGQWQPDFDRPSDVAMHPLTDRTQPIVLLENFPVLTEVQIAAFDRPMNALLKQLEQAEQGGDDDQVRILSRQMAAKADQYNQEHVPGYTPEKGKEDDEGRARILRRYRLYSSQPDEMITLRALGQMHPGQKELDPRLYQYGGLWIYPVGGLIKLASFLNFLTLYSDLSANLDHPENFARMYIVARAISGALWGLVAMLAVFHLVRRLTGGRLLPAMAALAFVVMPVVLDLAHQAKPHLPGLALTLLAVLAGAKYVQSGKLNFATLAAILCGAAAGMVMSAAIAVVLIPMMPLLRRDRLARFMGVTIVGVIVMAAVYFAANPYVAIHLWRGDAVLWANLHNSEMMYPAGAIGPGAARTALLLAAGASLPLAIVGLLSAVLLVLGARTKPWVPADQAAEPRQAEAFQNPAHGIGWMLAALSLIVLLQMARVGAGKPGEFGRFALLPDVALLIAAFAAIGRIIDRPAVRCAAAVLLVLVIGLFGAGYERAFMIDGTGHGSRQLAAKQLDDCVSHVKGGHLALGIYAEPAPYCLPPVDLYRWKIVLLPKDTSRADAGKLADVVVVPDDGLSLMPLATPMSWANKEFVVEETPKAETISAR